MWRHSRTLYELSGDSSSQSASADESLLQEALRLADRAVVASSRKAEEKGAGEGRTNAAADAHLWYAIILEALGQWKNLREKIADAFVIKGTQEERGC